MYSYVKLHRVPAPELTNIHVKQRMGQKKIKKSKPLHSPAPQLIPIGVCCSSFQQRCDSREYFFKNKHLKIPPVEDQRWIFCSSSFCVSTCKQNGLFILFLCSNMQTKQKGVAHPAHCVYPCTHQYHGWSSISVASSSTATCPLPRILSISS